MARETYGGKIKLVLYSLRAPEVSDLFLLKSNVEELAIP